MKHNKTILTLAFCALLLLLPPCRAYAAVGDAAITAEIPFTFQNDSSVPHICRAVIEPVDGAPAPEQSASETESGGEGRFVLHFFHPGMAQYRIYQTEKDRDDVIYDDRVYTVTVAVRNTGRSGLAWSMWATTDGEEKLDAIAFVNRGRAETPELPETPGTSERGISGDSEEPEISEIPGSTAMPGSPNPPSKGTGESPKTVDRNRLELYFTMMAMASLILVFIAIVEKHEKKEGDGI